jgi:hypothetical protein
MTSTYDLSWGKTSFPSKLKLFLTSIQSEKDKIRWCNEHVQASACCSLSSTYYSIVGTAFSQLKATIRPTWLMWLAPLRIVLWCLTWLPLAGWCYWRMLPLSDRMVALIGYDKMSPDQCDVRQSILRRRGRYHEAKRCIGIALEKNPAQAHTRGLLRVGLAQIYQHEGNKRGVEIEIRDALIEAGIAERQDPRQAARIYRWCANLTDYIRGGNSAHGDEFRRKAEQLARSVGANDQVLRL